MYKTSGIKILFVIAALFAACMFGCITAHATGTADFAIPNEAVAVGGEFEITVTFSGDKNIGWVDTNLIYDDSALEFISGDGANGGGGILTIKDFPDSESKQITVALKFKALKNGSSELNLSNCAIFADDSSLIGSPTAYASITADDSAVTTTTALPPDDSSETDSSSETTTTVTTTTVETGADGFPVKGVLKALTVSEGELIPAFSPDIYNYTVKVDNSVEYCEIEGTTASVTDYIWYEGSNYLQVGDNVREITVTDDNGNKRTYTIIIQRSEQASVTGSSQAAADEPSTSAVTAASSGKQSVKADDDGESTFDQYKKVIMPALGIVMFVLVLALVIIIVWLRKKSQERKEQNSKKSSKRK